MMRASEHRKKACLKKRVKQAKNLPHTNGTYIQRTHPPSRKSEATLSAWPCIRPAPAHPYPARVLTLPPCPCSPGMASLPTTKPRTLPPRTTLIPIGLQAALIFPFCPLTPSVATTRRPPVGFRGKLCCAFFAAAVVPPPAP